MRCGDFSPDTCCLTLQLKVSVITLRRKSARRSIVYLIPYVENLQSARRTNKKKPSKKSSLDYKLWKKNKSLISDTA